jgi:hypothetical protein
LGNRGDFVGKNILGCRAAKKTQSNLGNHEELCVFCVQSDQKENKPK